MKRNHLYIRSMNFCGIIMEVAILIVFIHQLHNGSNFQFRMAHITQLTYPLCNFKHRNHLKRMVQPSLGKLQLENCEYMNYNLFHTQL
jgi:hypothetical protein